MDAVCANPARERHEIKDGARRLTIRPLTVDWGVDDLRGEWDGSYVFCSFACLAAWASEKAAQHDGHTVQEGRG